MSKYIVGGMWQVTGRGTSSSSEGRRAVPDWQAAREWGPQSYNHKEGTKFRQQQNGLERGRWASERDATWLIFRFNFVCPGTEDSSGSYTVSQTKTIVK